jgi:hypothetical protein
LDVEETFNQPSIDLDNLDWGEALNPPHKRYEQAGHFAILPAFLIKL